jgi:hypothetical protein
MSGRSRCRPVARRTGQEIVLDGAADHGLDVGLADAHPGEPGLQTDEGVLDLIGVLRDQGGELGDAYGGDDDQADHDRVHPSTTTRVASQRGDPWRIIYPRNGSTVTVRTNAEMSLLGGVWSIGMGRCPGGKVMWRQVRGCPTEMGGHGTKRRRSGAGLNGHPRRTATRSTAPGDSRAASHNTCGNQGRAQQSFLCQRVSWGRPC